MADTAVAITAGSGTNIDTRTESTNSNHRQVIVIGDPATNAGVAPVDVVNGLAVQIIPSLPAGNNVIGGTVGAAASIKTSVTRPANTTAYTINDIWSDSTTAPISGGNTFTSAGRISGGSGVITDLMVSSSNDPATLLTGELWLLDQAGTNVTDNSAFAMADADVLNVIAVIPFAMASTIGGSGTNSFAHVQNLSIGYTCVGTANLRFLVKVKVAYTPASAEVLQFILKVIQTT